MRTTTQPGFVLAFVVCACRLHAAFEAPALQSARLDTAAGEVRIFFADRSTSEDGHHVMRFDGCMWDTVATVLSPQPADTGSLTWADRGARAHCRYCYKIAAFKAQTLVFSDTVCIFLGFPPRSASVQLTRAGSLPASLPSGAVFVGDTLVVKENEGGINRVSLIATADPDSLVSLGTASDSILLELSTRSNVALLDPAPVSNYMFSGSKPNLRDAIGDFPDLWLKDGVSLLTWYRHDSLKFRKQSSVNVRTCAECSESPTDLGRAGGRLAYAFLSGPSSSLERTLMLHREFALDSVDSVDFTPDIAWTGFELAADSNLVLIMHNDSALVLQVACPGWPLYARPLPDTVVAFVYPYVFSKPSATEIEIYDIRETSSAFVIGNVDAGFAVRHVVFDYTRSILALLGDSRVALYRSNVPFDAGIRQGSHPQSTRQAPWISAAFEKETEVITITVPGSTFRERLLLHDCRGRLVRSAFSNQGRIRWRAGTLGNGVFLVRSGRMPAR
ncbi:MAG: hypothetical protein GF418_07495, partial [Chitinivibrionales bacterium]|nr:hypothetical protein [Chitinivibrionales bacterium]MBD3395456.1 hypothetical protein [Chitinivibrionales bacterium]